MQRDPVKQRAGVYVWSAILLAAFSLLLYIFRLKKCVSSLGQGRSRTQGQCERLLTFALCLIYSFAFAFAFASEQPLVSLRAYLGRGV